MDNCGEALIGFVGTHGNALEFLELAEEVLDEMPPLVELGIERQGHCAARMLRDDDLGTALVQIGNDGIAVEGLVGDQTAECETVDQRSDAHRIEAMARQQNKADEIAERVGQRQDFGGYAALGTADRLALGPPFAPCP